MTQQTAVITHGKDRNVVYVVHIGLPGCLDNSTFFFGYCSDARQEMSYQVNTARDNDQIVTGNMRDGYTFAPAERMYMEVTTLQALGLSSYEQLDSLGA